MNQRKTSGQRRNTGARVNVKITIHLNPVHSAGWRRHFSVGWFSSKQKMCKTEKRMSVLEKKPALQMKGNNTKKAYLTWSDRRVRFIISSRRCDRQEHNQATWKSCNYLKNSLNKMNFAYLLPLHSLSLLFLEVFLSLQTQTLCLFFLASLFFFFLNIQSHKKHIWIKATGIWNCTYMHYSACINFRAAKLNTFLQKHGFRKCQYIVSISLNISVSTFWKFKFCYLFILYIWL